MGSRHLIAARACLVNPNMRATGRDFLLVRRLQRPMTATPTHRGSSREHRVNAASTFVVVAAARRPLTVRRRARTY